MNNIKYWIALEQSQGIGPAHLKEIFDALKNLNLSIIDLYDLTFDDIKKEFSFNEKIIEGIINSKNMLSKIEDDYFTLIDAGIDVIPFFSNLYPSRLHTTLGNNIPPILYTIGNKELLNIKGIAILGDKNVSEKGELISYMAAKLLSRHKLTTISGFAQGADMIAHRSALENNGNTIAIVPYGILHYKMNDFIKEVFNPDKILIVSTFYPTKEINKFNAFIRNKIICALSYSVYIVESPLDGGIFEAAKSAQKLNIPLFTTEYSVYPKNAEGNKKILEELGGHPIRGKIENDMLIPNMDKIIGIAKFG